MDILRCGSASCFAALRDFLTDSYYTEERVCERLGLASRQDYATLRPSPGSPRPIHDRLDLLARVFLIGEFVAEKDLEQWAPPAVVDAIHSLGLLARSPERTGEWFGVAALYPMCGLHLVSDRWTSPELAPIEGLTTAVYPPFMINTTHFLETLPSDPCENLLDLCSGTGVAALLAATGYARQARATDITERSTRCAEFNRRLNGIENATVAAGDLYEAADGQIFDRITANPPYMPSLRPAAIFADGGELGDRITRRIVEGLPKYLSPGGRFYCITAGPDIDEEPFEIRVRRWLGEAGGEFDIFLVERKQFDPTSFANQQAAKTRGGAEEVAEWKALFEQRHVENLFYGSVVIERKQSGGVPATVRRRKGTRITSAEIEWLRRWETGAEASERVRMILDSRPIAVPDLALHVVHRLRGGEMAPEVFTLESTYPFTVECRIEAWTAFLLARCDGKSTARELLAFLKENDLIHAQEPEEEFADFLRVLISGGFLEVEGYRLPPR